MNKAITTDQKILRRIETKANKRPNYTARRIGAVTLLALASYGAFKGVEAAGEFFSSKAPTELSQVFKNGEKVDVIKDMVLDGSSMFDGKAENIERIMPYNSDQGFVNDPAGQIKPGDVIKSSWAIDIKNGPNLINNDGTSTPQEYYMFNANIDGKTGWYYVNVTASYGEGIIPSSGSSINGVVEGNKVIHGNTVLSNPVTTITH
ncbi:MAG: hypothetical protein WCP00_02615, partial [bacterium]